MQLIDPITIRSLMRYEPETGKLYWLHRTSLYSADWKRWNTRYGGKEAFTAKTSDGYKHGIIGSVRHKSHRVIWALHAGVWPKGQIDHINGIKDDNRLINLRDVPHGENLKNKSSQSNNKSGVIGVSWIARRNQWMASIGVNGRCKTIAYSQNKDVAIAARKAAEIKYGYHPNHGRALQCLS